MKRIVTFLILFSVFASAGWFGRGLCADTVCRDYRKTNLKLACDTIFKTFIITLQNSRLGRY
jgi:hypothetical protein